MIDSGTIQVEVSVEGGLRTITIPMNHDLLKDTEGVIHAFGSFYSNAEHKTLGKLNDNTLSKSIVDLALKVSFFLSHLLLVLFCLRVFLSTYFLCMCLYIVILVLESVRRQKKQNEIYQKLRTKYRELRGKYKDAKRRLREGVEVPTLREELRNIYEEFLASAE